MKDSYQTVAGALTVKAVINRSEFLGHVKEVNTEEEAKDFIGRIKEENKQATHNCSAYSIGLSPQEITFSDDNGEPSGSAGKPILGAIKSSGITNVVIVVTRYFGGRKLGIRGLIDAYGGVAKDAIEAAGIVTRIITKTFRLDCDYPVLNSVMYHLNKNEAKIVESEYGERIKLVIAIRVSIAEELMKLLEQYGEISDIE
jgi:uncharacterized YigZ family protein